MGRTSTVEHLSDESRAADSSHNGGRELPVAVAHKLLTTTWDADVEVLEAAIGRFRRLTNVCHVVFFEIARDAQLHVNVTHRYATRPVRGWAGPAPVSEGFVHNRRFRERQPSRIIRKIRDVVFAART